MSRVFQRSSIYYATDKNIFDALNEHKVDSQTIAKLFRSRNTIVSHEMKREQLAEYFSRLNHDYYDHKEISARLGVVARRERITSRDVEGIKDPQIVNAAIEELKAELQEFGDVIGVVRDGGKFTLNVQYEKIDYKRSEFSQVQVRDGSIELQPANGGYIVRNTQNDHMDGIRDALLEKISASTQGGLHSSVVSLQDFPDTKTRSGFFYDLFSGLKDYSFRDLTDIYVYKPEEEHEDDEEVDHVERVILRGKGLSRSEFLAELAESGYYTVRVAWRAKDIMGRGDEYLIEATFSDPVECTKFSFILVGVHVYEAGVVSKAKRSPSKSEIAIVSHAIESRARELMAALRSAAAKGETSAGDGEEVEDEEGAVP